MQRNLEWQKAEELIPGRKGVDQEGAEEREHRKLLGVTDVFIMLRVVMDSWVYTYVKIYEITHLKCAQFMIRQLYINKAGF